MPPNSDERSKLEGKLNKKLESMLTKIDRNLKDLDADTKHDLIIGLAALAKAERSNYNDQFFRDLGKRYAIEFPKSHLRGDDAKLDPLFQLKDKKTEQALTPQSGSQAHTTSHTVTLPPMKELNRIVGVLSNALEFGKNPPVNLAAFNRANEMSEPEKKVFFGTERNDQLRRDFINTNLERGKSTTDIERALTKEGYVGEEKDALMKFAYTAKLAMDKAVAAGRPSHGQGHGQGH